MADIDNLIKNGNGRSSHLVDVAPKSEEVKEIMSQSPGWIVRHGVTLLLIVSILLLVATDFIKYPDVVGTKVTITSVSPPVKLLARTSGEIQQFFLNNNEIVKANDPICLIANPATLEDILVVKSVVKRMDSLSRNSGDITGVIFDTQLNLGEIQQPYVNLYLSHKRYLFLMKEKPYEEKLRHSEDLNEALKEKETFLLKQLELEQEKLKIDCVKVQTIRSSYLENKIRQVELRRNILQLNHELIQFQNDLKYKILENIQKLDVAITEWERKYLLKAPIAGRINFFKKENQFFKMSDAVVMIVPNSKRYECKASVPKEGANKIAGGQKVLIKLTAYPYQEFGVIIGRVENISDVPVDGYYSVKIKLSNGIVTTKGREVPAASLLSGDGEVLTNDRSVFERIFDRIFSLGRHNS
ncbi:MAG TPA: HlyD family efflux transporter periplasmic adaptor subunit [Cyclobacteriaceae bacterium]|nr:HlyD family efflux transporter periplasmic adaptor subunit [Cyclobacteriaceae bacterium]